MNQRELIRVRNRGLITLSVIGILMIGLYGLATYQQYQEGEIEIAWGMTVVILAMAWAIGYMVIAFKLRIDKIIYGDKPLPQSKNEYINALKSGGIKIGWHMLFVLLGIFIIIVGLN